jgi:hypothetical protein
VREGAAPPPLPPHVVAALGPSVVARLFGIADSPGDGWITVDLPDDGVMRDAHAYVNGSFIGSRRSGYVGFALDVTEFLRYGDEGGMSSSSASTRARRRVGGPTAVASTGTFASSRRTRYTSLATESSSTRCNSTNRPHS